MAALLIWWDTHLAYTKSRFHSSALPNWGIVVDASHPSTREMEAEVQEFKAMGQLHGKCEVNLGYLRP